MDWGHTLRRIGSLTSIFRTREEDAVRVEVHGGTISELDDRVKRHSKVLRSEMIRLESKLTD
jgi:hypothetical protein